MAKSFEEEHRMRKRLLVPWNSGHGLLQSNKLYERDELLHEN